MALQRVCVEMPETNAVALQRVCVETETDAVAMRSTRTLMNRTAKHRKLVPR